MIPETLQKWIDEYDTPPSDARIQLEEVVTKLVDEAYHNGYEDGYNDCQIDCS